MVLAVSVVMVAGLAVAQPPVLQDLAAGKAIGQVRMAGNEVAVDPLVPYDHARLIVRQRDGGVVFEKQYSADDALTYGMVDRDGKPLADGLYVYEFVLAKSPQRNKEGAVSKVFMPMTASGQFRVVSGMAREIPAVETKRGASMARPDGDGVQIKTTNTGGNHFVGDLTATGGVCSGCTDGDADLFYGELLVKDALPWITMRDTDQNQLWRWYSSSGDLRLMSAALNGTGNTYPLKVEAGSPNDAFVITATGEIGMGTATPADALHVLAAKTVIRLENTTSGTTWRLGDFLDGNFRFSIATNGQGGPTGDVLFLESATADVGIGTSAPSARLHVVPEVAGSVVALFQNGTHAIQRTDGGYANIRFASSGGAVSQSWLFQDNPNNGEFVIRDETGTRDPLRVKRGAPTNSLVLTSTGVGIGTALPAGTLDVNGPIYQRGGILHSDYVFDSDFELPSIQEHASLMWSNGHLPSVPARQVDEAGREFVDIGAQRRGMLEELEVAHIYIEQLEERLAQQEERLNKLEALLAQHE